MIKIVKADSDGKITLTEDELNSLLKEAYSDGYDKGYVYGINKTLSPLQLTPHPLIPEHVKPYPYKIINTPNTNITTKTCGEEGGSPQY